jgi:hypothetical protein
MKRLIPILLTVLCLAPAMPAAWNARIGAGPWGDANMWSAGAVPVAGDDANLMSYTVVMDSNRIPASGILNSICAATTGQVTVAMNLLGDSNINVWIIRAGTKTADGVISVTGAAAGKMIHIGAGGSVATVLGGSSATAYGIYHGSTANFTLEANLTPGTAATACALYINHATPTYTITSNIIEGGAGAAADSLFMGLAGTVNITCPTFKGGAGTRAHAVNNYAGGTVTLTGGNMIDGTGGVAWAGKPPVWNFSNNANYIQRSVGGVATIFAVMPDPNCVLLGQHIIATVDGNYAEVDVDHVRLNVTYGARSALVGTMVEPPEEEVILGTDYGADGIEYQGLFAWPIEGDVKLDVHYGVAGGSEKVGTYGGGGPSVGGPSIRRPNGG